MATKRGTARGSSGTYTQARGGARAERGGSLRAIDVIFMILAVAAAILLLLEFCSPYKPSNGFKKEELVSEQTENNEREADRSVSASFARVSAFSAESGIQTYSAVTPPCNHLAASIVTAEAKSDSCNSLSLGKSILCGNIVITNRISGSSVIDNGYVYFAEYTGCGRSKYFTTGIWCIHGIKSHFNSLYGYFFSDFEIDWDDTNLSSDWDKLKTKPVLQESFDSANDTYTLRVDEYHGYQTSNPPPMLHFPDQMTFIASKLKFLPSDPEKEGYTFTGWYTDEACTIPYEGETVTDDITLYAGWQINTYTLTLNGNGGELSVGSVSGEYNTVPTIPEPTRTGYTFTGWQTAAGETYDAASPLTQDLTLTAQWQINTYTLTLNGNGGDLSAGSVSGEYNTVPMIPAPTRTGYTFTGWQTAAGETYDAASTLTQDITLTAQWQINTYTITLNGNGGELSAGSVSGDYNTVPTIPEPTRTGYTFTGWKTSDGAAYDVASPLTQDLTLTAQWQIKTFTVTFMVDGAVYSTVTVEYGTKLVQVLESAEPALFALYSVDGAGASLASDYAIDEDITVHAEEGTIAQKIKGNWKRVVVCGVCGAVLVAFVIGFPAMLIRRRMN